jgi:hypothetical protein
MNISLSEFCTPTMVCFNSPKIFIEEFSQELHLDPAYPNEFDYVTGNLGIV